MADSARGYPRAAASATPVARGAEAGTGPITGMVRSATGIPIFVVSTFDTDYVLVAADHAGDAAAALTAAGHRVAAP